jgi:uroporphyrinogen decarboxylase
VLIVPVYRWDLPSDTAPLAEAIDRIIVGEMDFAVFTNAAQVSGLLTVSGDKADDLRSAMKTVCIGAVGPSVRIALEQHGLKADWEPDRTQLDELVGELSRRGHDLLFKKRTAVANGIDTHTWRRVDMVWEQPAEGAGPLPTIADSVFLKACRREPVPYTPVWIMRQAGRYQRAYREVRAGLTMIELCRTPEIAAEVTLMAVDRLGVDAAIIFSDILTPLMPMGLDLEFAKGEGPLIHNPVRTSADLERLKKPDLNELEYLFQAIRLTRKALRPDVALIGFAGAPFTVASYVIEGGKSRNYTRTKTMMHEDRQTWDGLISRLVDLLIDYLNGQIDAGADAIQLFDSWVGALGPADYRDAVLPHVHRLIEGVSGRVPVIHFATGNPALLPLMKEAGGDVIGLDWRVDLGQAWAELGHDVAVMGNLDPISLYGSSEVLRKRVADVLASAEGRPGHIFNLGHGVLPDHDPVCVAALIDAVHELSARDSAATVA